MSKITVEFEGTKYTAEFSRDTARGLQRNGFEVELLTKQSMLMIPLLVRSAFAMHHPKMKQETADMLYESIEDKTEFLTALVELYSEPVSTMFEAPDEKAKKAVWTRG